MMELKRARKVSRHILTLGLAVATAVGLVTPQQQVQAEALAPISVGILQFTEHGSLEQNRLGFIDGLAALGYIEGENLTINYVNGAGEVNQLPSLAESLVSQNDYFFAIATPAAQALANATEDKPVLFSSVSDPLGAGLVDSLEVPGGNVTGTSNVGPVETQITEVLLPLIPEAKKIGLIYNASEINAQFQIDVAVPVIEAAGLEPIIRTISSTNDISASMNALVNEGVDGIYLVNDNYIAASMPLVGEIAKEAGLPLVGGSNDMILENGLATYGLDYYKLGIQTADMLGRIINEEANPSEMAVETARDMAMTVNEDYAKALGLDPEALYELVK